MPTATVKLGTLRELVAAGSVRSATLLGQRGGYALLIRAGMQERLLASQSGAVKLYARIDTAARELRSIGLAAFEVDATQFEPGRLRPARPDRVTGLRRAHQVAGHDRWFRETVTGTLDRLERGEETLLSHAEVFAQLRSVATECDAQGAATAPKA